MMSDDADNATAISQTQGAGSRTVLIGDTGQQIPIALLRQVYSELTGKSESITEYYNEPFLIGLDEIEQLNIKVQQTLRQYTVIESKASYTIFYVGRTKEYFGSFSEFITHSTASSSPVESISIKYESLIIPVNSQKPETYTITIRIASRLSIEKKAELDFFGAPPSIIRILGDRTGMVEIKYADYIVARTLQTNIADWFKVLPRSPQNKLMRLTQNKSHLIPRIVKLMTVIIGVTLISGAMSHFIQKDDLDLHVYGQFFLYAMLALYISYTLAGWSARFCENSLDRWSELSYIKLNKADEAQIKESAKRNGASLGKALFGVAGSAAVNGFGKLVAYLVVTYLAHYQ